VKVTGSVKHSSLEGRRINHDRNIFFVNIDARWTYWSDFVKVKLKLDFSPKHCKVSTNSKIILIS
jgi:hypothetical protein